MVDDSPIAIFITKLGTLKRQGRPNADASDLEKALLVTGSGAVRLKGPLQASCSNRNAMARRANLKGRIDDEEVRQKPQWNHIVGACCGCVSET